MAVFFPFFLEAQVTADCSGAIVVCGDRLITLEGGPGAPDFNSSNNQLGDCQLTGETESVWLYFSFRPDMPDSSIIEFTIDPVQDGEIDYDFSLYGADTPCDSLGSPVRCSYAWVFDSPQYSCGFCPQTGLGNGETDVSEGPFGNGYLAPLAVYPGQGFYLYVNEFFDEASLSEGFNISFGGSAAPYLNCLVNPNCEDIVVFAGRDTTVCSGDVPFQLIGSATFTTGYETYTWTGTGGEEAYLDDPNSPQPTVAFPDGFSGTIAYILSVESGDCIHYDTLRLEVLPTPAFSVSGPVSFCSGDTITLAASSGFGDYQWSDTSTGESIEVTAGGLYSVTVTAAGGNCAIAREVDVVEHPLPQLEILGDTALCAGDTTFLDAGPGFLSYQWSNGGIGRYLPVTEAGDYTVEVVDSNGCFGTASINIIEVALPDPVIQGPPGLCPGVEASLGVFPIYSAYLWSNGEFMPQFNTSDPGIYTIEVWDEYGCRGADTLEVAALPGVEPEIFGPDTICFGSSTALAVDPIFDTYQWSTSSPAPSILVEGTGEYSITVTNVEGCSGADTLSVLELPALTLNLNVLGNSVLCTGDTIFLQATPGFEIYEWQNGAIGPVLPVTSSGSYTVEATDSFGCSETAGLDLDEFSLPQPVIAGPDGLCPGASASLQAGNYFSYLWSDGSAGAELSIDGPGSYSVTVVDDNGCEGAGSLDVAAYTDPQPVISGPGSLCEGTAVILTVGGGPFGSYRWQDNSTRQQLLINDGGAYSVTVANAEGCTAADTLLVELVSQPVIPLPLALSFCENESLVLDPGPGFAAYNWSDDSNTQTIEVSLPGTYSLTVTDANGCTNSQDMEVASNPIPEPTITGNLYFCQNTSSTLSLAPSNYDSISWSTGSQLPTETFDATGEYSVVVMDSNGCIGNYAFLIEELEPTPVTIAGESLICEGATDTLFAGPGYSSYLWSTGDTVSSIPVSSEGIYTVTITNGLGCEGYDTLAVEVQPLPQAVLPDTLILCEDGELALNAGAGPYVYSWNNGLDTEEILIDAAGIYSVTVTDQVGCQAEDRVEVLENEVPSPQIDGSLNLCPGDSAVLTISEPYVDYVWSNGETSNSILVTRAGFYTLTVTDEAGCQGTANILVNAAPAPEAAIEGPEEICAGETAILDAGNHFSYLWSNDSTGRQLSASEEGLYSVVVTNFFGCRDTAWAGLMVLPLPDPGLQEDTILCEGGIVILEADTSYLYYLWDDNSSGPTREVDAAGTYSLTVSDGTCSDQDTVLVVLQPAPQPVVTGSATVCPGEEVALEVLGDWPGLAWSNGATGSAITVGEPGTYTVTVEDSLGCPGTGSALVEHFETIPAAIIGDAGFCPGDSASLGLSSAYADYLWSTGSTAASISVNSAGVYAVTVTDDNGCADWVSLPVSAYAPPLPNIGGETIFCEGGSAQVFVFGTFASYAWSNGETTKLATVFAGGDYTVTVTNDNGCRAAASIAVAEQPLPVLTVQGTRFCPGDSTELYVEEPYSSYLWQNGAQSPSIVVDAPGAYGLTVTDELGCEGSVSAQVEEWPAPQPEIIGGTPICLGVGATTNLSLDSAYQEVLWNTGEQTDTIAVDSTGLYFVTVTDANGCQGTAEFDLRALPAPALEILGDSAFCQNSATVLEAVTTGDSLQWSTGATGPQVTASQPDTYSVTAFGSNGCQTTASIQVEEIALPLIDAGGDQAIDCREQPVQLGHPSNPSDGLVYTWSGPGINDDNRNLPMPWVTEPGTYTVEAVTAAYQCRSMPAEVAVADLRYEPDAVLLEADTLDCSTPTVELSGQGSAQGNNIAYQWYTGSGALLNGETGLSLTVSQTGMYTLVVTDNATGCTASAAAEVVEGYSYPQVDAGPEGLLNCDITSLQLSGRVISTSSSLVFTWATADGRILEGGSGLRPLVDAPGLYVLTVEDLDTGCEASDTVRVRQDIQAPVADAGESREIDCLNQEAQLDGGNSSQGTGFRYEWRAENGFFEGGTLYPTVNLPGTYYLTVTNLENGCSSADEVSVLETDDYLTGMEVDAIDPLCFGDNNGLIAVTEVRGGTGPFLFSINGEPFMSQQQFPNLAAGAYDIRVQDAAGCEYSIGVLLEEGNDVQVRLGDDLDLGLGDVVTLQALTNLVSEEIMDVIWSYPVDTFPCLDEDCLAKELRMKESALITATVVDSNGCRGSDELHLILRKDRKVYIPNAFSPNNDGPNDNFTIFADMGQVVRIRRLLIMDRWGEKVFDRPDFLPNNPELGWDGTLRGQTLNPAVFAYFAEIEFVDGEVVLFKGSISLLR
ncbi:MAG: gliding motility-associated C-terminal domain-containing protein [Lewinellaceae bacterium]|nr:gliding motility-associated C-terminal domain-containing protein [Phaeodactylibacter sp.]MCB9041797.1 gliding motility-associated C-terminal domain-containing protein [Lewinellaceae bacterium]